MLFDFSLRSLEEVQPWGKHPNLTLSWFGFTEGFYRLQVGSEFLLNYSDKFVTTCAKRFPNLYSGSFVDYYVVRLWESILDMLPDVLEPLPIELSAPVEENKATWFSWANNPIYWVRNQPDEDEALDTFVLATSWLNTRRLDTAYLQNSPNIWMWSTARSVTISWDNTGIVWEGLPVWSATKGHYTTDRNQFLDEVHTFHNRLIAEMAERVDRICGHWNRPEIYIDTEHLKREQQDRAAWLDQALQRSSTFAPWDSILSAFGIISTAC